MFDNHVASRGELAALRIAQIDIRCALVQFGAFRQHVDRLEAIIRDASKRPMHVLEVVEGRHRPFGAAGVPIPFSARWPHSCIAAVTPQVHRQVMSISEPSEAWPDWL